MKLALTLVLAGSAFAHDLYIMPSSFFPSPGQTLTLGFHVGDSFPNSEVAGRIPKLIQPKLNWPGGSAPVANLRIEGLRDLGDVTAPTAKGSLVATVATMPNFIELAPAKFLSYLQHEGLDEIIAYRASHNESDKPGRERYSKYARALLRSGATSTPFYKQPSGLIIEIIPEADPYALKPGDQLPVQVLFRGKPAANLHLEASWAHGSETKSVSAGRTDSNGRLKVTLPKAGLWRLHTIQMERCADRSAADWESFWSSLTFQLENAK